MRKSIYVGWRQVIGADGHWKDAERIIDFIREEVVCRSQSNYHDFSKLEVFWLNINQIEYSDKIRAYLVFVEEKIQINI